MPAKRMKGWLPHTVPLSAAAKAIVDRRLEAVKGACLFPAVGADRPARWSTRFTTLLKKHTLEAYRELAKKPAAKMERWTLHGIRTTMATVMQDELRVPNDVVSLILSHRPTGITAADVPYLRGKTLGERRAALVAWGDWLGRIGRQESSGTVLPMAR